MSPTPPSQSRSKLDLKRLLALGLEEPAAPRETDLTPKAVPKEVGDYEILSELGRGGMGVVYQARQRSLNRLVALKMILGSRFSGESQRLRFKREAETIAALRHPNIVSIHEVGEFEGIPFYSMDYIEGENLKDSISRGLIPWREAVNYTITIARAMQFAHEHKILHRDLKPQNVMIDGERRLHITDFGLARNLDAECGLTLTGESMGTPYYMAPEQVSGKPDAIGRHADIYSIGAILFEMLASVPPFLGSNTQEILEKVKYQEALGPRVINGSVPKDLNTVCLKCLEKEPPKRYASSGDMADDLERVLEDRPILAKPVGPLEKSWRWCRRNRALASVLIGSATVIILGTAASFWMVNERRIEAENAQEKAVESQKLAEQKKSEAESAQQKAEESRKLAEQKSAEAKQAQAVAEEKKTEAEANLKKFLQQKDLTTQAEAAKDQESLLRQQAVKNSNQVQAGWARESLNNGDFVEAYRQADAALAGSPKDATAMQILAATETACFNIPAAIQWMERAAQQAPEQNLDTKVHEVLSKYGPVYLKLSAPLQDRELQIALVTELLSINHPLFNPAANYIRKTNPAILDEKLKALRKK